MKYLNLGCGLRFHSDWVNIDGKSSDPSVLEHDLRKGIPYPDNEFRVVYHSHVLEHFQKDDAVRFLEECHRVLGPKGVIRIAVPDLERIAKHYLEALDKSLQEEEGWSHHHEWMMLELYDQAVREKSGGAMGDFLRKDPLPNEEFIRGRMGGEVARILESIRGKSSHHQEEFPQARKLGERIMGLPRKVRGALVKVLLGAEDCSLLEVARFRSSGEIHRWMYDRHSLKMLLARVGFKDANRVGPTESRIPDWPSFNLDTDPGGAIYKPDSLYMEAIKD